MTVGLGPAILESGDMFAFRLWIAAVILLALTPIATTALEVHRQRHQ